MPPDQRLRTGRLRLPRWADVLLLIGLCVYILAGTAATPYHGDESTYSVMSRDYDRLFITGDLAGVLYQEDSADPVGQLLRIINGSLTKYLMGFSRQLAGFSGAVQNADWDWSASYTDNIARNARIEPARLLVERLPSALLTCVGAIVLFALTYAVAGRGAAWGSVLLFAFNPVILLNGRRAVAEGAMMAFMSLTVLAGWWVGRSEHARVIARRKNAPGQNVWRWALLGMAMGLALASKHSNLSTVGLVMAALLILCLPRSRAAGKTGWRKLGSLAARLLLMLAAAFAVFMLLNPAWWDNPLLRILQIVKWRANLLELQLADFGAYTGRLDQAGGFFGYTFGLQNQYFESPRWFNAMDAEIAAYERSGLGGLLLPGVLPMLTFTGLALYGLAALIRPSLAAHPSQAHPPDRARWLVIFWGVGILLSTWLLTPLSWQRYYLPAIVAACLFAGIGLDAVARWVVASWSRRRVAPSSGERPQRVAV